MMPIRLTSSMVSVLTPPFTVPTLLQILKSNDECVGCPSRGQHLRPPAEQEHQISHSWRRRRTCEYSSMANKASLDIHSPFSIASGSHTRTPFPVFHSPGYSSYSFESLIILMSQHWLLCHDPVLHFTDSPCSWSCHCHIYWHLSEFVICPSI